MISGISLIQPNSHYNKKEREERDNDKSLFKEIMVKTSQI